MLSSPLSLIVVLAIVIFVTILALVSRFKRCPSDKILVVYGRTGGSSSVIAFAPARGIGVVALSNSASSVDALGLKILPNLLAIDSGCLWGGPLTAVRLEDRAVFQVPCSKEEIRAW